MWKSIKLKSILIIRGDPAYTLVAEEALEAYIIENYFVFSCIYWINSVFGIFFIYLHFCFYLPILTLNNSILWLSLPFPFVIYA